MKALVLNGSPNTDYGITAKILTPFLKGLKQVGCEVNIFNTAHLNITPCSGKLICWKKKTEQCIHHDDVGEILQNIKNSEIIVIASPVHSDGVTGTLKNLFDRMIPLKQAKFTEKNGRCRHINFYNSQKSKVVFISTCGFYEMENFYPIVNHIKAICDNYEFEFSGSLLRPHSLLLKRVENRRTKDILLASFLAGKNFLKKGYISHDFQIRVSQEITSKEIYLDIINRYFENIPY